jgi:hypothetical protein
MTFTGLMLILAVALVNLSVGFGAAALVGRGPWSARARLLQAAAAEVSSTNSDPTPTVAHEVESAPADDSPLATSANSITPSQVTEAAKMTPQDRGMQTLQGLGTGLELIENQLTALHQQIQNCVGTEQREMLPQWLADLAAATDELTKIAMEFQQLAERDYVSAEARKATLGFLASLQQTFQEKVSAIGQQTNTVVSRETLILGLLTSCQQTRGAITAASFLQTHV